MLILLRQIGAGIQIPPNATRVMQYLGLEEDLQKAGAVRISGRTLKRYSDGKVLCFRPGGINMVNDYGASY